MMTSSLVKNSGFLKTENLFFFLASSALNEIFNLEPSKNVDLGRLSFLSLGSRLIAHLQANYSCFVFLGFAPVMGISGYREYRGRPYAYCWSLCFRTEKVMMGWSDSGALLGPNVPSRAPVFLCVLSTIPGFQALSLLRKSTASSNAFALSSFSWSIRKNPLICSLWIMVPIGHQNYSAYKRM